MESGTEQWHNRQCVGHILANRNIIEDIAEVDITKRMRKVVRMHSNFTYLIYFMHIPSIVWCCTCMFVYLGCPNRSLLPSNSHSQLLGTAICTQFVNSRKVFPARKISVLVEKAKSSTGILYKIMSNNVLTSQRFGIIDYH